MIYLTNNWRFKVNAEGEEWYPINIPGTVLQGLYENKVIGNPFYGCNEHECAEWLKKDYIFETTFLYTESTCVTAVRMHLKGLCTLATVLLNGSVILSADNMHREWVLEVELKKGKNLLQILFSSSAKFAAEQYESGDITYTAVGSMAGANYLRQAHSMFGWDWGPQLPDMGVWKEAFIEEVCTPAIADVVVRQQTSAETANIKVDVSVENLALVSQATVHGFISSPCGKKTDMTVMHSDNKFFADTTIASPSLWWPNGYGEQPLYTLVIELRSFGQLLDVKTLSIGLRSLTVSTVEDSEGNEFCFVVNGVKVFAMGANYIPEDAIVSTVNEERTKRLLQSCRDSNFNCIRVWGGGYYPDEYFYDICDRYGLIVWQDFMFACNVYRLDAGFEDNIRHEAIEAVKKYRNHACLGLMCSNNEVAYAWDCWGDFQKSPAKYRQDYERLFKEILPRLMQEYCPQCFYWSSSPCSTDRLRVPNDGTDGDVHVWSVWNKMAPVSEYYEQRLRFCSEFGFQSLPHFQTLSEVIPADDRSFFSRSMLSHQKAYCGNGKLWFYLSENYPMPKTLEQYVFLSQVMQADALETGIMAFRKQRGYCMGALYWQLNDCWPGFSWSTIDYKQNWKLSQYRVKKAFAPIALHIQRDSKSYEVFVCNETCEQITTDLELSIINNDCSKLFHETLSITVAPYSVFNVGKRSLLKPVCKSAIIAGLQYMGADIKASALCTSPNHFQFKQCHYLITANEFADRFQIAVSADCLAKNVWLYFQEEQATFSDNGFDICDLKPVTVTLYHNKTTIRSLQQLLEKLKILDLNTIAGL